MLAKFDTCGKAVVTGAMTSNPDTIAKPRLAPDTVAKRVRALWLIWLIGGGLVSLLIGYMAYGLSGFCICDAPIRPKPEEGFMAAGITFAIATVLCGLGYLARKWAIAIWIPIVAFVGAVGFVVFVFFAFV